MVGGLSRPQSEGGVAGNTGGNRTVGCNSFPYPQVRGKETSAAALLFQATELTQHPAAE